MQPLFNKKVKNFLNTVDGRIMFYIVQEFLEFCGLDFTLSVYELESCMEKKCVGRQKIVEELGFNIDEPSIPILLKLVQTIKTYFAADSVNMENSNSVILDNNESIQMNQINKSVGEQLVDKKLNTTFNINSPSVITGCIKNIKDRNNVETEFQKLFVDGTTNQKHNESPIYEDISSVVEEFDNSTSNSLNCAEESEADLSQKTLDKSKLSQKSEKVKVKTTFSSLSDLSSLQHKSRVSDILPSLYSKEFKEKSNLRELDKMFDMEAEYEEDFICTGENSLKSYLTINSSKTCELVDEIDMKESESYKGNFDGNFKTDTTKYKKKN